LDEGFQGRLSIYAAAVLESERDSRQARVVFVWKRRSPRTSRIVGNFMVDVVVEGDAKS
jgi:hypothetical protein